MNPFQVWSDHRAFRHRYGLLVGQHAVRHAPHALVLMLSWLLFACTPHQIVQHTNRAALLRQQRVREQYWAHVDHWLMRARLGVSNGHHGGSVSLIWVQHGAVSDIRLHGPIFSGVDVYLRVSPHGAVLKGLRDGPLRGPHAREVIRQALGWNIPLRDLRAWLFGLRVDHGGVRLEFGSDGLPVLLQQHGWSVRYRNWDVKRIPPLPCRIFAAKPPYKVRLAVQSWEISPQRSVQGHGQSRHRP